MHGLEIEKNCVLLEILLKQFIHLLVHHLFSSIALRNASLKQKLFASPPDIALPPKLLSQRMQYCAAPKWGKNLLLSTHMVINQKSMHIRMRQPRWLVSLHRLRN
jgi:hypothetical protein